MSERTNWGIFGGIPGSQGAAGGERAADRRQQALDFGATTDSVGEKSSPVTPPTVPHPDNPTKLSSDFAELQSRLKSGFRVEMYRVLPKYAKGLVDVYDPEDEIDLKEISRRWGGQRYRMVPKKYNAVGKTGGWIFAPGQIEFSIAGTPKKNGVEWLDTQVLGKTQEDSEMNIEMMRMMFEMQNKQMAAQQQMMQEGLAKIAASLHSSSVSEQVQQPPKTDPLGGLTEAFTMIEKFRNLAERVMPESNPVDDGGGDDDDDSLSDMLMKVLPSLLEKENAEHNNVVPMQPGQQNVGGVLDAVTKMSDDEKTQLLDGIVKTVGPEKIMRLFEQNQAKGG